MLNEKLELEAYITDPESENPRLQPLLLTDSFSDSYKLDGISQILLIIARGFVGSEDINSDIIDDKEKVKEKVNAAKEVLNAWCGFDDDFQFTYMQAEQWWNDNKAVKGWLKKYLKHNYKKYFKDKENNPDSNFDDEFDKLWKAYVDKWKKNFNDSLNYKVESTNFNNIIADALLQGELKERFFVIKKAEDEPVKKKKSKRKDQSDLTKEMKLFEYLYKSEKGLHATSKLRLLKSIAAYLLWQEEYEQKQEEVLIKKTRLFGWYGQDNASGKSLTSLLEKFKWEKTDKPIVSIHSYYDFSKMLISSEYIDEFGFRVINAEEMESYMEDYWILEDGGHGLKKAFIVNNRDNNN